jgi:urate oxidase
VPYTATIMKYITPIWTKSLADEAFLMKNAIIKNMSKLVEVSQPFTDTNNRTWELNLNRFMDLSFH